MQVCPEKYLLADILSAHNPIVSAGAETPEQFLPVEAEFCLITFTLLPSPFLNATSLAQRNAAKWTYETNGAFGATTFVAPRLDRSIEWYNGQGSQVLDVTDNIYIGARPGHNKQAYELHAHMHMRAHTSHDHVTST